MPCLRCGSLELSPSGQCSRCGEIGSPPPQPQTGVAAPVGATDEETRLHTPGAEDVTIGVSPGRGGTSGPLAVGQNFGPRYHIIRCIGAGGMGAVYQAWDQELEVAVAVKVIRPDAIGDPQVAAELERRFKRELVLARKVTHKNVVRIHDIGEIGGVKYITMPYVHGSDLATVLKKEGRLPVNRALAIGHQIASGLVAAHEAGVVHRDLKPANVMVDADDHAMIMDFGIARSTSTATAFGMTVAGAVVGTVEYMAPEQARGESVDHRADIYAFGLILRDLMLGGRHAGSTTAVAELMSRMQQAPGPVRDIDPSIPPPVDALLAKCLQPDSAKRFQTTTELLKEVERVLAGDAPGATVPSQPAFVQPPRRRLRWSHGIAAAAAVLALALGGYALNSRVQSNTSTAAASDRPTVSLAVLPFRNATGDPGLNSLGGSLSEVLTTDLGEAKHIRMIPSQRLQEVLNDLRIDPNSNLSPSELARIAGLVNAGSVLWGQYVKFGDEIRIDATLQDLEQRQTTPLKARAANDAMLLDAVAQLAGSVQQELAKGSAEVLQQLQASAWRPTTNSLEALRMYNEALQLARQGNHQKALDRFKAAVDTDTNFALAYSALAQTYATLGYDAEAAQFSRRAFSISESMPAGQERLLIAGAHYRLTNDDDKAIDTYQQLLTLAPNNVQVQFDLASLYEQNGAFDKAKDHFTRTIELDPKHVDGLTAVGRVNIKRGDPQAALQPLNSALSLAVELDNNEARATVLQAIGIAYKRMARPADALKHYEQSLEIRRTLGQKRGMAASLSEIAQVRESMGQAQEAVKSYNEALALQREIGDQSGTSITLINLGSLLNETLGRPDEGLRFMQEALRIVRQSGDKGREALALNNIGSAYLSKGQFTDAQTYFELALQLRENTKIAHEIADTLHNLGETLSRMGRYDHALTRYLRALDLRRQSGDKRLEAIESYSIGTVFDYQGRYGAAVQSKTDALKAYRELKQRDFWLGEILSGHGASLSNSGRFEDAGKSLDEATAVANELKNAGLIGQINRMQSERLLYQGDPSGAAKVAKEAIAAAERSSDQALKLWAEAQVARTGAAVQPTRAIATTLARISRDADRSGSIYLSVLASVESAETVLKLGDHRSARQEVDRTLSRAEALGLRELHARSEYVMASSLRAANDQQARRHYAAVTRILDEMKREQGAERILERADIKAIYEDSKRWSS
jgi:eukaryotic-like serine/threonine-protein kinase